MTELQKLFKRITGAKTFGELLEGSDPVKTYRALAKRCHPDVVGDKYRTEATVVFAHLAKLYEALNGGAKKALPVIGGYVVKGPFAKGDICDLYQVESEACSDGILKIVRSEYDNDLLEQEVRALKAVHADPQSTVQHYAPKILSAFKASSRRAVVLEHFDGYVSLEDILAHFPSGLPFLHVVWMMNRLLSILGFIHERGIVHGAVLPAHLLFHPEKHDLRLIDWCYSSMGSVPIPARVKKYADLYPPEVLRKTYAYPSTDLYMSAETLRASADKVPKRFRGLFDHCTTASPNSRPASAWIVQDRWKELAREEFGPPAYVRLTIPVN